MYISTFADTLKSQPEASFPSNHRLQMTTQKWSYTAGEWISFSTKSGIIIDFAENVSLYVLLCKIKMLEFEKKALIKFSRTVKSLEMRSGVFSTTANLFPIRLRKAQILRDLGYATVTNL